GPAVGQPDFAPVADLPPRVVAEPGELLDVEHVGADGGNALEKGGVQPLDGSAHQGDRDDADHDAERREAGTHLVGANRVPGDGEAFAKFSQKIHPFRFSACIGTLNLLGNPKRRSGGPTPKPGGSSGSDRKSTRLNS